MNIRDLLNPELGIRDMPSKWWRKQVHALLIMNKGILLAVLQDVPPADDCTQFGLGHGQCIKFSSELNPISAIMNAMHKRMAAMNGCDVFVESWPGSKLARACSIVGIKNIYCMDNDNPNDDEIKALKEYGVKVVHVSI